jgi:hypothetical protein
LIRIRPSFLFDDPAQGVSGWRMDLYDLPEIIGPTKRQRYWAGVVRQRSLHAFVDMMLRRGGDEAITARHYWTPELEEDVRKVEDALNAELVPLIESMIDSDDWTSAVGWDRDPNDAGIIVRLLQEERMRDARAT